MKELRRATVGEDSYSREVRHVLKLTLALNLAVVAGKLVAGFRAGSLSVISDAMHSSADSLNNLVGLVIIRLARAAPDEEHPYGHHKFETVATFAIAGFLLVTAFEVVVGATKRLLGWSSSEVEVTTLTVGVMVVTLIVNIFVWSYESRRGKALNSSFLIADSKHTLSDIFVSLSILIGLMLVSRGMVHVDPILAFVVAGVITYAAYQIFASTIPVLVDSAPLSSEYIAKIVRETPGVESVHEIRSRGVPGRIFISMHLVVTPTTTFEAHAVTEEVERRLAEKIGPCTVTIHVEPDETY
jgi:cation diffusion facilitator family transporter